MMNHDELVKKMLDNPRVKMEYDALADEFALFKQMIKARREANLTQEDVAKQMETTKSVISRLESISTKKKNSPSIDTLRRYAKAVGCSLEISLKSKEQEECGPCGGKVPEPRHVTIKRGSNKLPPTSKEGVGLLKRKK